MLFRIVSITLLVGLTASARGEDAGLAKAKELYLSASYEEALSALDDVNGGDSGAVEVFQYRAFCLLALQRQDEARQVIEEIYVKDPFFRLSESQTAPRVLNVFREVRRKALPMIVQHEYADARKKYEQKDPDATALFDHVLTLMDDPDVTGTLASDFRVVVSGFRDLSQARTAAAVVAPPPPAPAAAPPAPAPAAPPVARGPEVIVKPVILSRPMPHWVPLNSADAKLEFTGQLQLAIDEQGRVVSAVLPTPIYPRYDEELLQYARRWRFKPATRNGVPAPFEMFVPIQLTQSPVQD